MHPPADMASGGELQARGAAALEAGRLEEAEACYRELLALQQHPLALSPDWRWRLDRDTSAFYSGMRLIRQRTIGNWNPVIDELTASAARWEGAP